MGLKSGQESVNTRRDKKPVVLFGGNMGSKDVSAEIRKSLKSLDFAFKEVDGVYKGDKENTFVIPYLTTNELLSLIALGKHFSQESLLLLDKDRNASLLFMDRPRKAIELGKFRSFTEKQFDNLNDRLKENYTFDGDYYYVTY